MHFLKLNKSTLPLSTKINECRKSGTAYPTLPISQTPCKHAYKKNKVVVIDNYNYGISVMHAANHIHI